MTTPPPAPPSVSCGTGERIDLNLTLNLRKHILFFPSKKTCANLDGTPVRGARAGGESRLDFLVPWTAALPQISSRYALACLVFESVDRYAEV